MRLLFLLLSLCATLFSYAGNDLWSKFIAPGHEARTKVWWFHGETETTEKGIDADLKSFRDAGIGGVVFYDQVHGKGEGAFDSMSPEWWNMLKYAAQKAQELDLSFEVAASNGYVAGGPWITPELGMQKLAVIDTIVHVANPKTICIDLSHEDSNFQQVATLLFPDDKEHKEYTLDPESCTLVDNEEAMLTFDAGIPMEVRAITYSVNPRGKGSTGSMNIPGMPQERYFGALYTELSPIGTLEYSVDGRQWFEAVELPAVESVIGHKSNERTVSFPPVMGRWYRVRLHDWMDAEGRFNKLRVDHMRLSTRDLIDNWQVKSGLRTEVTYPRAEGENIGAIPLSLVQDVTNQTDEDGNLCITLEPGCWHILRFGHIPTYGRTKHGRSNLLGLEADVMSARAAKVHYENYFKAILDTLTSAGYNVDGMCMDSHEAGIQNWTPGFDKHFAKQRGYELTPWLPTLAGYIVSDRKESERVLQDFRKTIAETIATEFYGTLASLCRSDSVTFTSQAMLNIDNDNILSRSKADKPQGEFWAYQTDGNYDCLDAVSAAHLYGLSIASGEAFTDSPYTATWEELLRIANLAYCRGINEFAVCASSYQPWIDSKYDDSNSLHPYIFHRHNPAWASVGPFWEYQARCATMLREGVPVVDLCIFLGEDFPTKTFAYKLPLIPEGYNFDVCTRDALMNRFSASEGELTVEGGMRYRALVVQDRSYYSPEALQKIDELANAGVPVIRCDLGENVGEKLKEFGIIPDVSLRYKADLHETEEVDDRKDESGFANTTKDRVCFFHRKTPLNDIYFLYNHSENPFNGFVKLRSFYNSAEIWNPETVTRKPVTIGNNKTISLHLEPYESTFLILD